MWREDMLVYFCPWTLSFVKAHSFPRATLLERCSLFGTDHIRGQIHIFAQNGGYWLSIHYGERKGSYIVSLSLSGL